MDDRKAPSAVLLAGTPYVVGAVAGGGAVLWSLVHFLLGATVALPDPFHFSERYRTWQDYGVATLAALLGCLWLAGGVLAYTGHRRGLMLLIPIAALEAGNYAAAILGGRNPISTFPLVLLPFAIAMASGWAWDASRPG